MHKDNEVFIAYNTAIPSPQYEPKQGESTFFTSLLEVLIFFLLFSISVKLNKS